MKFCKKYQEYMQGQENKLPVVGFKNLKKILKKCRKDLQSPSQSQPCPHHCPGILLLLLLYLHTRLTYCFCMISYFRTKFSISDEEFLIDIFWGSFISLTIGFESAYRINVCDGTFFPSLLNEMSAVVGCFNERAQKLLDLHLASGLGKCFIWFKGMLKGTHVALVQEGRDLVTYALINAVAIRKILKKYDKIHYSKQGQAFKSQAQSMHIEILQSPWLCELMAFHINLRETKLNSRKVPALFEACSLKFTDDKPSLSCELFDSVKIDIDLTCSICLDTVFDPVSLTCGHIFCYMCACSAAAVTIVDGLKSAEPKEKCPLCREGAVYEGSVHLDELSILLSRSCREYWEERLRLEKVERVRQAKEHWECQCRAFVGV